MHFVLRCDALSKEWRNLLKHMELVDWWQIGKEGAKLTMILKQLVLIKECEESWRKRAEADLNRDLPHRAQDYQPII